MWRTLFRLSLMLFTCDFHRDRIVEAEPIRLNAELVSSDHEQNSRTETRGQPEGWTENLTEPVGKWRNNGGALEPKWRDGDSIPLLPFSQISRYSNERMDSGEDGDYPHRRGTNHQQNNGRDNYLRPRKIPRLSYVDYEDHESAGSSRGHQGRKEIPPRKRNRLRSDENAAAYERPSNRKEEEVDKDLMESLEAPWHRETLQTRPSKDYGYEFSDEEYLKPKPRKRRPPQNYEFALSKNETSANAERIDNSNNSWSKAGEQKNRSDASKNTQPAQNNAVELKSLLKMQQEEGLSLSEVLQRRNLTLNDLLKGKADAINALRMKDVEENEYYSEDAARTLPNFFVRLSTTRKPQWPTSTEAGKIKNSRKDDEFVFSINPVNLRLLRKNRINATGSSSSKANMINNMYSEAENANGGKISIPIGVAIAQGEVAVTTSVPVATDSTELMQADEATVKSQNSGEIKTLDLDEDEIMEFSDFTDYKKGRTGGSPVWLMMKEEQVNSESSVESSKGHLEDVGSTLSIEKILSPTESSESAKNSSIQSETGKQLDNKDKLLENQRTTDYFKEDYNTSSEKEYQGDGPRMNYEVEYSTQISSTIDESGAKESVAQEIESELDVTSLDLNATEENRQSYPSNHQIMEESDNRTAKNHQDIGTAEQDGYDDVSEVEPEARAEIFELFSSGSAGKRLERLLKSRNMSLEELIALRQRGSSKVHLAEVSRIKAQKSNNENMSNLREATTLSFKEKLEPSLTRAIANRDEDYNSGLYNYLSQTTENVRNTASTSRAINIVRSDEVTTELSPRDLEPEISNKNPENDEREDIKGNHRTVHIVDLLTTFDSLPLPKDVRDFTNEYNDEHQRKLPVHSNNLGVMFINNDAEAIYENETTNVMQSGFVKEVIKQEPSSINIQTEYNTVGDDESNSENGKTLSKVKPSIIASGAILGVTLVVFLAIFIVCKIQQKQKYRYRSTFSRAVFQGPIMAARKLSNSSSLSNVMVNVVATSTAKRPERNEIQEPATDIDSKSDIDNDSLDANDSWETIPDYMK